MVKDMVGRVYSKGFVVKNHGKWRAVLPYKEGDKHGKLTKSTGIKCYQGGDNRNKLKAETFLQQWREELILQAAKASADDGEVLYDYCERLLSTHHVKAATMSGYRATMSRLRGTTLACKHLADVTGDDIRGWEQGMRDDGVSEATLAHHHAFVSMVLKYAVAQGAIVRNPILSVKSPRRRAKPVNSLTRQQRAAVLRKMDECENYSFATAVRIALLTGMRRAEICALRWCDVDLSERTVRVNHALTKDHGFKLDCPKDPAGGDTTRVVPIGNVLTAYLRTHRQRQVAQLTELGGVWRDTLYVVGDPVSGTFLNPETLGRQWSMLAQAEMWKGTQGERVRFHDLRHTFATLVVRDHVMDVMSLSKILGHRDASMTLNVYSDALAEAKRSGMDALDVTLGLEEGEQDGGPRPHGRHMRRD